MHIELNLKKNKKHLISVIKWGLVKEHVTSEFILRLFSRDIVFLLEQEVFSSYELIGERFSLCL